MLRYYRIGFIIPVGVENDVDIDAVLDGKCSFPGIYGNPKDQNGQTARIFVDWETRVIYFCWQRKIDDGFELTGPPWGMYSAIWDKDVDVPAKVLCIEEAADLKAMTDLMEY